MKTWIAINLYDFHNSSKKWQGGNIEYCNIQVIGAKTLERAKRTATTGNNYNWLVFPINDTKHIAYNTNREQINTLVSKMQEEFFDSLHKKNEVTN